MASLLYANVDSRQLAVLVKANGQYWNWAGSKWESPYNAASHLQQCVADPDFPTVQTAKVPGAALVPGVLLIDFVMVGTTAYPSVAYAGADAYAGPLAGRGSLMMVP